jgi:hypothetical protein
LGSVPEINIQLILVDLTLLFQKKKRKAFVLVWIVALTISLTPNSAKRTQGVWGLAPRNKHSQLILINWILLFPEKEAKSGSFCV